MYTKEQYRRLYNIIFYGPLTKKPEDNIFLCAGLIHFCDKTMKMVDSAYRVTKRVDYDEQGNFLKEVIKK